MCQHNRKIIEEFIQAIKDTLSESARKKELTTLKKELSKVVIELNNPHYHPTYVV
ncbi:hypothetical protein [Petrocella sp. FN5]|uniref:hypothetical protein n=1 Tax=Petrocella sp. FN5 TaxID=3032002 RepID=UPI0023DCCA8D|nr:hypothetical protein [Petrocella sp. FN5]MDF1616553.1 hypothetical protein [Petrocella sp. FN5]